MTPETRDLIERRLLQISALAHLIANLDPEICGLSRHEAREAAGIIEEMTAEISARLKEAGHEQTP